eukprot:4072824-Pleurochrysis_carterae.AAC.5
MVVASRRMVRAFAARALPCVRQASCVARRFLYEICALLVAQRAARRSLARGRALAVSCDARLCSLICACAAQHAWDGRFVIVPRSCHGA